MAFTPEQPTLTPAQQAARDKQATLDAQAALEKQAAHDREVLLKEQQALVASFDALTFEAKVNLLEKIIRIFGPFVTGVVKIGASSPGVIPPSGEIDPKTGAPILRTAPKTTSSAGKGG